MIATGAGAGAGSRAERQLQHDGSVSHSGSLSDSMVRSVSSIVSGSVSGKVSGRFSSSNIGSRISSGSGIWSWTLQRAGSWWRSSSVTEAVLVAVDYAGASTGVLAGASAVLVGLSIGHLVRCRYFSV